MRRALLLLALGSALGVFFAAFLGPRPASGDEAPAELRAAPAPPSKEARELSRPMIEATSKVRPAVVQVLAFRTWRGELRYAGSGSGFVISKNGYLLTNGHVVEMGTSYVIEMHDGHRFTAVEVVGTDPRSDVAVMKITDLEGRTLPVAELGDSDTLEVGEIVLAIGAPYNLEASVSMGVVSATGRTGLLGTGTSEDFIQTDAALNAGNSGGPLVNLDGQVVGINTAIRRAPVERTPWGQEIAGGGNIGIGFTVPINLARTVAISLIEKGVAPRGRIGIYFNPKNDVLSRRALQELEIDAQGGIRITGVEAGSAAAKAGLVPGDVLVEIDGRPLTHLQLLHARLAQAGAGGTVELKVYHEGKARTVKAVLGEGEIPSFGIEVETLTPERAAMLKLKRTVAGVVVTRIREGSVAALADSRKRLLPGDVIVAIDWGRGPYYIRDKQSFEAVMAELDARPPRMVQFTVLTEDGILPIPLAIPEGMG